ncbi:MAG: DUF4956 domain-containing protein [Roseburia sp.]
MLESLLSASTSSVASVTTGMAFIYTILAGVLGLVISLTYLKTGKVSKNFARTLIILPILVCVVMLVVNGNLGTSVAIVGAFSLIRFRSLQGNSRDIAFVFFAMSIGLICSIGDILFAMGITALVCVVLIVLNLIHYAEVKTEEKELKVTMPENLDYMNLLGDLMERYTTNYKMARVKTTNMGSLYEITYVIQLREAAKEKEFLDAIRCRNGNLTVICGRRDYNAVEEL